MAGSSSTSRSLMDEIKHPERSNANRSATISMRLPNILVRQNHPSSGVQNL